MFRAVQPLCIALYCLHLYPFEDLLHSPTLCSYSLGALHLQCSEVLVLFLCRPLATLEVLEAPLMHSWASAVLEGNRYNVIILLF